MGILRDYWPYYVVSILFGGGAAVVEWLNAAPEYSAIVALLTILCVLAIAEIRYSVKIPRFSKNQ